MSIRRSPGCKCCGAPTCGEGCVQVNDSCTSSNILSGVTIDVFVRPVSSVTLVNGGSSYANGNYTNGTFTGGIGSGGTFSYSVVGGVIQATITVTHGGSYATPPTPVFNAGLGFGASATAALGSDTAIGSCTTTGQVVSLTRTNGGSGYTNGTYTNGTFSGGGGTGGSFGYSVVGGVVQLTLTVLDGGSGFTSAPGLVINAGGGTGFAGTATVRGRCCVPTPANGPYTAVALKAGYALNYGTFAISSCNPSSVSIGISWYAEVIRTSCPTNQVIEGIEVAVTQSGNSIGTYTTNAQGWTGNITIPNLVVAGTFGLTISHPRFVTNVISNTSLTACVASGGGSTRTVGAPASGYRCFRSCSFPLKDTLYLTDPVFGGPVTLTFNPTWTVNTGAWVGTQNVSFGGDAQCAAATIPITYAFAANGPAFGYNDLQFDFPVAGTPTCPVNSSGSRSGAGVNYTTLSCPPSFNVTVDFDRSTFLLWVKRLYGSSGIITFTITE